VQASTSIRDFVYPLVGWSIGWLVGPSPYCFAPGDLAPGFLLLFVKYDSYDIYESRNTFFF
jgi:hypothetical protein